MMYSGGAAPLFDTGALDGEEANEKSNKTGGMFDDDSDDNDFLNQITKPAAEQKASILAGTGGGGVT